MGKPHLAAGLALYLLARRDARLLAGAVCGVGLVIMASLASVGIAGLINFITQAPALTIHTVPLSGRLGSTGLSTSWFGTTWQAYAATGIVDISALSLTFWLGNWAREHGELEFSLAGALLLSLLVSPDVLVHDLTELAPAFVWCSAKAARADMHFMRRWPGGWSLIVLGFWATLSLAAWTDFDNTAAAPPGRLVPWCLAAGGILCVVACRRFPLSMGNQSHTQTA